MPDCLEYSSNTNVTLNHASSPLNIFVCERCILRALLDSDRASANELLGLEEGEPELLGYLFARWVGAHGSLNLYKALARFALFVFGASYNALALPGLLCRLVTIANVQLYVTVANNAALIFHSTTV